MRREIISLLILIGISFFVIGCEANDKIHLATFSKAIGQTPYLIAKNQGWFEEVAKNYGVEIEYTVFQSLPPINEALATGNVDLVIEAAPPAIIGKAAGIDIRVKGITATYQQEILVHKDSEIKTVYDLKNKKVAVLAGTSSDYLLPKMLQEIGLTEDDVLRLSMIPPDAKAAFESRQIDAWAVWPPYVEQQVAAGNGRPISQGDNFIQVIVVARNQFVEENPNLAKDLLDVIEKSKQWAVDNEEEAKKIIAQELELPLEVVEDAWLTMELNAEIGKREIEDIQAKADFLFDKGFIKKKVIASEFVDLE